MVAANCACNFFRNKSKVSIKQASLSDETVASDYTAAETITQEELSGAIEQAFRSLSAHEHIILKLNHLYDKTHQEIARILRMPVSTVSSLAKRSKERLREQLKNQGWDLSI